MSTGENPRVADKASLERRPKSRAAWRVVARSEIERMRSELKLTQSPPGLDTLGDGEAQKDYLDQVRANVNGHLDEADRALVDVGPAKTLGNWYSGFALERTWLNIHRGGEALLMIQAPESMLRELLQADAAVRATIETTDPRYASLTSLLNEINAVLTGPSPGVMTAVYRSKLKAVRNVVNVASDTAHETVRHWRNLLVLGGLMLAAAAITVVVVHAFIPAFFSLRPPGAAKPNVAVVEPWEVVVVGCLGGALAAVLALNRFSGFTDPSGLPVVQALLRIPAAAATSLVGVLLMQTSALGALKPQTGLAVLAYAFLFGYAQEPLLRAIDRQAGAVLNPARNKDEPAKTIPPAPAKPLGAGPSDGNGSKDGT